MVCYSTRKSSKWGVCSLRGSFDPPNGPDKPWWPTLCIDKVFTDVHKQNLAFLTSKSGSPKKWCAIAHENRRNEAYTCFRARLTLQMARTKKFGIFYVGIRITQKMVCYNTRKSSKWGVCSLRGSVNPPNGLDNPWWPTVCIEKVLTDVHEKIWHFWRRNPDHPKNGVL